MKVYYTVKDGKIEINHYQDEMAAQELDSVYDRMILKADHDQAIAEKDARIALLEAKLELAVKQRNEIHEQHSEYFNYPDIKELDLELEKLNGN